MLAWSFGFGQGRVPLFASECGTALERVSSDSDEPVGRQSNDVEGSQVAFQERVAALQGLGTVADQSGCAPDVGIVPLIPIDKALAASDARNGRPASSKANVVLAVEEVSGISGVEIHWFESFVSSQWRARPFPEPSSIALATQCIFVCHGSGMPIVESDVVTLKVDEEVFGTERGAIGDPVG